MCILPFYFQKHPRSGQMRGLWEFQFTYGWRLLGGWQVHFLETLSRIEVRLSEQCNRSLRLLFLSLVLGKCSVSGPQQINCYVLFIFGSKYTNSFLHSITASCPKPVPHSGLSEFEILIFKKEEGKVSEELNIQDSTKRQDVLAAHSNHG